ncbi:MAG TPA: class I SAM-dependent methyltransferase [Candidatus Binatia bacterium]|nr:class I SAM-dependent methyltransferase [Candidatus Binatia bacterium]
MHRLPFRAAAFDHVVTNAVLEHVANPFRAVAEVSRVLRPGGVFAGSAAFLEPYHDRSRFHLAPDGLLHVLRSAGLAVRGIWPQEGWLVFDSLAEMPGPVSAPTRWVLRRLAAFERRLRRRRLHPRATAEGRRWLAARTPAELDAERLHVAGQIDFVAEKP